MRISCLGYVGSPVSKWDLTFSRSIDPWTLHKTHKRWRTTSAVLISETAPAPAPFPPTTSHERFGTRKTLRSWAEARSSGRGSQATTTVEISTIQGQEGGAVELG